MPTPKKEAQGSLRPGVLKNGPAPGPSPEGKPPVKSARLADGGQKNMELDGLGVTVSPRDFPPGFPADSSGGGLPTNLADRLFEASTVPDTSKPADAKVDEEPSMKDLMKEMRKMNFNLETRFDDMQRQIANLKHELQTSKLEMVTKHAHENLEKRVANLEAEGVDNAEISWMQRQVQRLDPANKSLCFTGFTDKDGTKRLAQVTEFLTKVGSDTEIRGIDHIWSGPPGKRAISTGSVVELSSRLVRDFCLKKLTEDNSIMATSELGTIAVRRAKTEFQRNRNNALYRAEQHIKSQPGSKGKPVKIIWQIEGKKDRGVECDGQMAFLQSASDLTGKFLAPFEKLDV